MAGSHPHPTVDDVWSTVGSCNVDSLNLFALNEINLEVYSERFASFGWPGVRADGGHPLDDASS